MRFAKPKTAWVWVPLSGEWRPGQWLGTVEQGPRSGHYYARHFTTAGTRSGIRVAPPDQVAPGVTLSRPFWKPTDVPEPPQDLSPLFDPVPF